MSAIVNISVNLSKVEKAFLNNSKKGDSFLPLTVFINDEEDEYGNDVAVILKQTKEERDAKKQRVYLGNGNTVVKAQAEKAKSVEQESLLDELGI